jgi:hypothetical protein
MLLKYITKIKNTYFRQAYCESSLFTLSWRKLKFYGCRVLGLQKRCSAEPVYGSFDKTAPAAGRLGNYWGNYWGADWSAGNKKGCSNSYTLSMGRDCSGQNDFCHMHLLVSGS